jgi:hypothetical protein
MPREEPSLIGMPIAIGQMVVLANLATLQFIAAGAHRSRTRR